MSNDEVLQHAFDDSDSTPTSDPAAPPGGIVAAERARRSQAWLGTPGTIKRATGARRVSISGSL
jgi:hypothetical protein